MGLKRIGKGPFRGPTKGKLFQTWDIGADKPAEYIVQQAKKFPRRQYIAVDPNIEIQSRGNIRVFKKPALEALDDVVKKGLKLRHINMFMPEWQLLNFDYFRKILNKAKKVMLPNGKFFVGVEANSIDSWSGTGVFANIFKEEGFSLRKPKLLHKNEWSRWMHWQHIANAPPYFYLIEATFRLKTARKMGLKV